MTTAQSQSSNFRASLRASAVQAPLALATSSLPSTPLRMPYTLSTSLLDILRYKTLLILVTKNFIWIHIYINILYFNVFNILTKLLINFQPGSSIPKVTLWIVAVQNVSSPPRWKVEPPNTLDGMYVLFTSTKNNFLLITVLNVIISILSFTGSITSYQPNGWAKRIPM